MVSDWILNDNGKPLKLLVQVADLSEISSEDKSYFRRLPWPVQLAKNNSNGTVDLYRLDPEGPNKLRENIPAATVQDYIRAHK